MTGAGSRFKAAGFDTLKPYISVAGKPMIEWVTNLFPGYESCITYICREEHLETLPYAREILQSVNPTGRIASLTNWNKKGPVFDVMQMSNDVDEDKPVIVCYCDFFMTWDFSAFLDEVQRIQYDGAIPCYTGFHPHLLVEKNVYASCRVDKVFKLLEIREKFSWTADKKNSLHSPGVYYFRSGALMKKYFGQLVASGEAINGEFYCSMAYNGMVDDDLNIWCPPNVEKFCQWGTPYDMDEFNFWHKVFKLQSEVV